MTPRPKNIKTAKLMSQMSALTNMLLVKYPKKLPNKKHLKTYPTRSKEKKRTAKDIRLLLTF